MNKYKLYASVPQDLPDNIKYSFCDPQRKLMFVYTDGEMGNDFVEVTEALQKDMTIREKNWYKTCVLQANATIMRDNEADIVNAFSAFLEAFENELKVEADNGTIRTTSN